MTLCIPASLASFVIAGMKLRNEGGANYQAGGGFLKWLFWGALMLTIPGVSLRPLDVLAERQREAGLLLSLLRLDLSARGGHQPPVFFWIPDGVHRGQARQVLPSHLVIAPLRF